MDVPMKPQPFVASYLRQVLFDRQIAEQDLARAMGLTKSGLSRKINGSRPWTHDEMGFVARYLGMDVGKVFPPSDMYPGRFK